MLHELAVAFRETLYMVTVSTVLSVLSGFMLAVVMVLTCARGLRPNAPVYATLDLLVNLLRSFPFIILMIAIIPLTRFVAGTSIGSVTVRLGAASSVGRRSCHAGSW